MLKLLTLAMMATGTAAGQNGSDAAAPLYVTSEAVAGGVRFQVIAHPKAPFSGAFVLEVTSGGNHSRHEGAANLRSGEHAILSTVTVGLGPQAEWRAQLRVKPADAAAYEQVLASK